jgi:hypothetical protein
MISAHLMAMEKKSIHQTLDNTIEMQGSGLVLADAAQCCLRERKCQRHVAVIKAGIIPCRVGMARGSMHIVEEHP